MEKKQLDKLIDSVMESFSDEFEDIEELNLTEQEDSQETPAEPEEEKKWDGVERRTAQIRKLFVTLAVVMMFFSVIGVVNSVVFVKDTAQRIISRQALKDEFALFVYPVVINDPPAFDSVDNLQASTIITCSVWRIILTGDTSRYNTDSGLMFVPEVDVESAAYSIFGIGKFDHRSVFSFGIEFRYNDVNKNYEIPENSTVFSYSPLITEVTNVGELHTVTIDYMEPSPLVVAGIVQENRPAKRMVYTISRSGGRMKINSIQVAEVE